MATVKEARAPNSAGEEVETEVVGTQRMIGEQARRGEARLGQGLDRVLVLTEWQQRREDRGQDQRAQPDARQPVREIELTAPLGRTEFAETLEEENQGNEREHDADGHHDR